MTNEVFKLFLGVIGLLALVAVLLAAARNQTGAASSWTRGGAVALAVSGLFGLLVALGRS